MLFFVGATVFAMLMAAYAPYLRAVRRYLRAMSAAGDARAVDRRTYPTFSPGEANKLLPFIGQRHSMIWEQNADPRLEQLRKGVVRRLVLFYITAPLAMLVGLFLGLLAGGFAQRLLPRDATMLNAWGIWGVGIVLITAGVGIRQLRHGDTRTGLISLAVAAAAGAVFAAMGFRVR